MDIEKTMQFILETQAKHEIAIQQWDEGFLKFQQEVGRFQQEVGRFQQEAGQRFSTLVDVSLSLARHGEETDRRIRELTEAQASTDDRLNALIDIVDKLVKRDGSRE